tara:strand:- start:1979 stop:2197 length:219 start_codon:yes stop_codon:yes gene_type:complete
MGNSYRLSDEACGAFIPILLKCLAEQSDIVPLLKEMEFDVNDDGELFVMHAPEISFELPADHACACEHEQAE